MCEVCGRTLLRGEHAETYLSGATRRLVCELCKSRAQQEGWVREGTVPSYQARDGGFERRRSLLSRLRGRPRGEGLPPSLEEDSGQRGHGEPGITLSPPAGAGSSRPRPVGDPATASRRRGGRQAEDASPREPRHVRAVPTSAEQRASAAVELFNHSEHCRTVAGIARSLGRPDVRVSPSTAHSGLVSIVISWELCWYRYEVDLSDADAGVRVAAQGYELAELSVLERTANAVADENGSLSVASVQ